MNVESTQQRVSKFWTNRAQVWDDLYDTPSPFWRWFNRVFRKAMFLRAEYALKYCAENDCKTVLDVGSGSGRVACLYASAGMEKVVGVDVAPTMVELAKQLAKERGVDHLCEFTNSDFMEVDFREGETFDAVAALGVFDYLDDPVPFARRMGEVANKFIFFSAPSPTLVRHNLRRIRYGLRGCPVFCYTKKRLRTMMQEAGFERIEIIRATMAGYCVIGWK